MIIKLEYEDIGLVGIKTTYSNNRVKNHYIRYIVDEFSIDKVIKEVKDNKWVVALDYEGDNQHLFDLSTIPDIPVIITKEVTEINELTIDYFMTTVPDWVFVAIKTPKEFSDMRIIEKLSQKYKNIRFCGGTFLRLPTCNIGCIQRNEIPKKISDNKISYFTEGCACPICTMRLEDVEGAEFIFKDKEEEKEVMKEETKKKIIRNIEDLLSL